MSRRAGTAVTAGLLAAVLATTAARPLYHADLWGHLAYGRFLSEHGVPETEPLMPLSANERFVDLAPLSQVAGWLLYDTAGPEGLRLAGGLLVAVAVGLTGAAARRRGRRVWAGWAAGGAFLAVAWMQLFAVPPWADPLGPQMLRPQTLGVTLFAGLIAAVPLPRRPGWRWWGLPVLFAVWANTHGSWPVGLALLAAEAAGPPLRRQRRGGWRAAVRSPRVRRSAGLLAACAAACCVSPFGPGLFGEVSAFDRHPNLADVVEWRPMTWEMTQGRVFFAACAALAVLARLSPRRVRIGEAAVLIGFGLATCGTSRWVLWWAGPAAVFGTTHLAAVAGRRGTLPDGRGSWALGIAAGVLLSVPAWRLAQGQWAGAGCLAAGTPVRAAAVLRERGTTGLVFNAHRFGDFLLLNGPPGTAPFVASHAHLIPPKVWRDHRTISAGVPGWNVGLARYEVRTLMLSPREQPALLEEVQASPDWREVYRDRTAALFERVDGPVSRRAGPSRRRGPPTTGRAAAPPS